MRAVLFAKEPLPGEVKSRLAPALGDEGAAALQRAMVGDTLDTLRLAGFEVRVSLEGRPGWFDADWEPQAPGDLGARMLHGLREGPVLAFGGDSPTLPVELLRMAAEALEHHDVVLGPAFDGGYWTLGWREPQPALLEGIAWSTGTVYADTVQAAARRGLSLCTLPFWYDVDTPPLLDFLRQHLRTLPPETAHRTRRCLSTLRASPTT